MKKQTLYLLFTFIAWMPLFAKSEQASLIILTGNNITKVSYWPLDGKHLNYLSLADTVVSEVTDTLLHIRYTAEQPVLLQLVTDNKQLFQAYLTNGSQDTICLRDKGPLFSGTNKLYNECLTEIAKIETYCDTYGRNHELEPIDSLELFNQRVENKKKTITELLQREGLSPEFIRQQTIIADCILTHLFYKKTLSLYKKQKLREEWMKELKEKISFNFQRAEAFCYPKYRQLLDLNIQIDNFILQRDDPKKIGRESICSFLANEYQKKVTGKSLEYAWASLLYNDAFQSDYTESIPALYKQFCLSFPNSIFKKILEPGVEQTRRFHEMKEKDKSIMIFPSDSTLASLEEAVKPFKGKVIYVDVWATWCGPCKKMFPFGNNLRKTMADRNIVYLYISIDRPTEREKWEKTIYFYQLTGNHILAGEKLARSLYSSLGDQGILSIPRFVIIGKDGKVAIEQAAAPNEPEKVIKQLNEVSYE